MIVPSPLSSNNTSKEVVLFKIYINEQEIARAGEGGIISFSSSNPIPEPGIQLAGLSISKSFNKIATSHLSFFDGDPAKQNFFLSNADLFKPGNALKLVMGYKGEIETIFKGIITKHKVKAIDKMSSLFVIEAKDKAVKLSLSRKNNIFNDKTDADIIRQLAQQSGIHVEIDPTSQVHKEIVQYNATDWDFIVMRAEMNGLLVLTDDNVIKCIKPTIAPQPVFEAQYGNNLYELEAEIDARRQTKKITSKSWDYTRQEVNSKQGRTTFTEGGNLSADEVAKTFNIEEDLLHAGFLGQKELEDWANATTLRSRLSKICARVKIAGEPALKPGQTIRLKGVGERFNGSAFISGIVHQYYKRWETEVQLGWGEDWFYHNENITETPAAGMLPAIQGLQIGVVIEEADDNDPDLKVKVALPMMGGLNNGVWARLAMPEAGKDRGVYFRPKKNDEVILGFINNDPRHAIILGSLYSRENNAAVVSRGTENKYGYVSAQKQEFIINDDAKTIHLKTGNCSIKLDGQSNTIELSINSNKIKITTNGIEVNASGTVDVKGTPIKLN